VNALKNPFVGLRPFETDDSLLFFGRDGQIEELLERLHQTRFVAVVGSSGCGKSSLVRAGLIPALEAGFLVRDRDAWIVAKMKPGDRPIHNLASALSPVSDALPSPTTPVGSEDSAASAPRCSPAEMAGAIERCGAGAVLNQLGPLLKNSNQNVLLLVDQFEELFRFGICSGDDANREEAAGFVGVLLDLARQRELPFYVVLTMRSDFLGSCDAFRGLPEAMNQSLYLVPRLTRGQRQEAIEGPIRVMGSSIAPRLLDRLLNEPLVIVDQDQLDRESDQLPVLQHAMMRTWEQHQSDDSAGRAVDIKHYELAGTLGGALEQDADAALEGGDVPLTRCLFQALTDTDAANRQIRRPARLSELQAITGVPRDRILTELNRFRAQGRCFLVWPNQEVDPTIDICHESLIRRWSKLREWAREEAASAEQYKRLAHAAERHAQETEALWVNPQLQLAIAWRQCQVPNAAWSERHLRGTNFEHAIQFLADSEAAAVAREEKEEEQRRKEADQEKELLNSKWRAKRNLLLAGGTVVVAALVFANFQIREGWNRELTLHQNRLLTQNLLARQSQEVRDVSPQQSVLLAVESFNTKTPAKAGVNALLAALSNVGGRGLGGHTTEIRAMALSRSGRWLITASIDGAVRRWDLSNLEGDQKSTIMPHFDPQEVSSPLPGVKALTIAPDESVVAVGLDDGHIVIASIGDVRSPTHVTLAGHQSPLSALAVSEDGHWLISGNEDGEVRRWDLRRLGEMSAHSLVTQHSEGIAFIKIDRDNRWLLTGSRDREIRLRSLAGENETSWRLWGVSTAEIAGTTPYLIAGGVDGSVKLWTLGDRGLALDAAPVAELRSNGAESICGNSGANPSDAAVTSLALSRPEQQEFIAIGNSRGDVCVWSLHGPDAARSNVKGVAGEGTYTQQLRFSPDGRWLAIVRPNEPVRLVKNPWDIQAAEPIALRGHDNSVLDVAFTPDSRHLISGSLDGTARLWDLAAPDPASDSIVHRGVGNNLATIALSASGRWLFAGHATGAGELWDLARRGGPWPTRAADGDPVIAAEVSRNERWLVTRTASSVAELWALRDQGAATRLLRELSVTGFDISACGQWLIAASRDGVKAWQLGETGIVDTKPIIGQTPGQPIASLAAGKRVFAAASIQGPVRLWRWDGSAFNEVELRAHVDRPIAITISRADRWLAVAEEYREGVYQKQYRIRLWDLEQPAAPARVLESPATLVAIDVSRDQRWLVAGGSDGAVRVFDLNSRAPLPTHTWSGNKGSILAVVASPDSRQVATGGGNGEIRLWDLEDRRGEPVILPGPGREGGIASVVFLEGGRLTAASVTGTVRRWRTGPEGLLDVARVAAGRNLSGQEWEKYFQTGTPCRPTFTDLPDRCADQSRSESPALVQAMDRWAQK
jgi:WD40 repeat protein/energy-coupling factor transporter ATP-binding protein EcfA2